MTIPTLVPAPDVTLTVPATVQVSTPFTVSQTSTNAARAIQTSSEIPYLR